MTDQLLTAVRSNLDGVISQWDLPPAVLALRPALAGAVDSFVESSVQKFIASDQFEALWLRVNAQIQQDLVKALNGDTTGAVTIRDGTVYLDLSIVAQAVQQALVERGLTIFDRIPIPQTGHEIVLLSSSQLDAAQTVWTFTEPIARWLLPIVFLLYLGAVMLAPNRRRMLLVAGLVVVTGMVLLAFALNLVRSQYVDAVSGTTFDAGAPGVLRHDAALPLGIARGAGDPRDRRRVLRLAGRSVGACRAGSVGSSRKRPRPSGETAGRWEPDGHRGRRRRAGTHRLPRRDPRRGHHRLHHPQAGELAERPVVGGDRDRPVDRRRHPRRGRGRAAGGAGRGGRRRPSRSMPDGRAFLASTRARVDGYVERGRADRPGQDLGAPPRGDVRRDVDRAWPPRPSSPSSRCSSSSPRSRRTPSALAIVSALRNRLGLDASTTDVVTGAFQTPENVRRAISVLGLIFLFFYATTFTTALQRVYLRAWRRPRRGGLTNQGRGLLWIVGVAVGIALLGCAAARGGRRTREPAAAVVVVGSSFLLWWWTAWVLLRGDVRWRALMPGAPAHLDRDADRTPCRRTSGCRGRCGRTPSSSASSGWRSRWSPGSPASPSSSSGRRRSTPCSRRTTDGSVGGPAGAPRTCCAAGAPESLPAPAVAPRLRDVLRNRPDEP